MIGKIYEKMKEPLDFVLKVMKKSSRDGTAAFSAQSAFFILMSVFPFTMLILQLMKYVPISQENLLLAVDTVFPDYLLPTIHEILQEIYSSSFGLVAVTVVTTLWASSKAVHAMQQGLGRICNEDRVTNWFFVRAWAVLYTFLMAVFIVFAVVMVVFWQRIRTILIHYRPRGISLHVYSSLLQAVYMILLVTLVFAMMYKLFTHKKLRFIDQLPGALLASIGCYGFSLFVTIYISEFHGFSMYGSLTTLTLVMFWLYFCNYFIMIGAEVNEVMRREREMNHAMKAIGVRK